MIYISLDVTIMFGVTKIIDEKYINKDYGMNDIKVAYLLVAHKCPEQVNIFINQLLNYGECDIYVHVDKKNPDLLEKIIKAPRVFVCSMFDVRWGSFEIVRAAIELMKMATNSEKKYTHMYFGSGQDLLVRNGLYEYLGTNPHEIYLHIEREVKNTDSASARYRVCWPHTLMIRNDLHFYRFVRIFIQLLCRMGIVINKNRKILRNKVKFFEGRTWFIAPNEVIEYIVKYINENPDYVDFWKDSLASDLMFFQTIIMNSPYSKNVEDELMYVNFGKTFTTMNHPLTITMDKISDINAGEYFFARKFEIDCKEPMDYFITKVKKDGC